MSTASTRPVALRMTDAERERLLQHGGTPRAAVGKLLDLADEHATCEPPRGTRKPPPPPEPPMRLEPVSTAQQGAVSTQQQGERMYEVQVAGRTVFTTASKQLAERRRKREQDRNPKRRVEVR